ncbi:putative protein kinase RLK-Pelle-LRR-XII-1 family [Helianthus annuus]|nr:putative protein kinase RLK-Pelle-LRR-XII-1 family [Helianthus annuus]
MNSKQPISCSSYSFLFYALIILTSPTLSASYSGNETDYQALLKIKLMISQDPYGALSSWNASLNYCDWNGVLCGKRHRRVTYVVLESLGLEGSLSPHVGNLSFLRLLSLWNNSFQGRIPHELGHLSRLRVLVLEKNKFDGGIPSNLSSCSNLQGLYLSYNKLVGSIPNEISILSKLTILSVSYNNFTGGIPPFLGNVTSIKSFSAVGNPLGGSIPSTLGYCKNLREIFCGVCNLSGTIPLSFFNLSLLTNISLAVNQLSGSLRLPPGIGATFPYLLELQLNDNQLSGPLPYWISNCSRLIYLEMNTNSLSGKLAIDFTKLRDIYQIYLGKNLFGSKEADEMNFIASLKNCTKLDTLSLRTCNFQGVLPRSIGNLSDQLRYLSLSENHLHGNLPSSIGNLIGLAGLYLGANRLTGYIPSTIGKLQKLQAVELHENQFSGPIPDAMGNLSSLITLLLFSNRLEGLIPSSLGNDLQIQGLDFRNNKLSGKIPIQLFQLPSLTIGLYLSQNSFSGSLPTEVGGLNKLNELDLSYNNLSGNIPNSLGGCVSLTLLSFRGNLFQGMIPQSLSSLRGVVQLDLSDNNLSGPIPSFLEEFSLEYMNLSFNDFDGEVPVLGAFANASTFSVFGNKKLCGGLVELGLPKCKDGEKHNKKLPLFVVVILIVFTLFTIVCLTYAWFKKKSKNRRSQSSNNERFLKVSYNQLLKATNGFSESNLLGNGGSSSVYKGILDTDDRFVAVKVLHLQNRGAQRSFIRECEALRNIRHRNLLKIITICSSIDFQGNDFKALVYEFMPNGSLHDWLHSNLNTTKLSLLQRIKILTDVASALDYIHNHCIPAIVHGDLKPSNILLDDDMVAHVGDFGLARFLGTTSYQHSSTGIRGTVGYVAPEYGLGSEMTNSGDVYSFGILLLELMTAKKPTDDIFNEDLSLHKFAYMALPNHITDVIDVNILNIYQDDKIATQNKLANTKKIEECLTSIVEIGVSCSFDYPSQRMDIEKVVHELRHITDMIQNIEV